MTTTVTLPHASIFKAYDIRGIVGNTLTPLFVQMIGVSFGLTAKAQGMTKVVIGRDGRLSGEELSASLSLGLRQAGLNVIDIGMVVTPMVYFATHQLQTQTGIMVTGSHNPPDYNGLKMVLAGDALYGAQITALRDAMTTDVFTTTLMQEPTGHYQQHSITEDYLTRIINDIRLKRPVDRPFKVAIDCGNGVAGAFAQRLFEGLGCIVTPLFCEVDGTFPNHHPDPAHPENLQDLIDCLRTTDAELGIAFDGDGDRLGVVTKDGQIIFPDRQMMLFAADVLQRQPNSTIIYDVKCTQHLGSWIQQHGGTPLMWQTGHSLVKAKLKATGAPLAGEMSGHIFFKERWYGFDDGLYAGARLLEILSTAADPSALLNALPDAITTPELHLKVAEGENHTIIQALQTLVSTPHGKAHFTDAVTIHTIDGVRVDYADGFGLARASNTTPVIVLRFEANDTSGLARIQTQFKHALLSIIPASIVSSLTWSF